MISFLVVAEFLITTAALQVPIGVCALVQTLYRNFQKIQPPKRETYSFQQYSHCAYFGRSISLRTTLKFIYETQIKL